MKPPKSHEGQRAQHPDGAARPQEGSRKHDDSRKTGPRNETTRSNQDPVNEGEGSRSAARAYNEATQRFVGSGRVAASGARAKAAIEGAEKGDLERAEAVGKSKMRGEDPAIGKQPARR